MRQEKVRKMFLSKICDPFSPILKEINWMQESSVFILRENEGADDKICWDE